MLALHSDALIQLGLLVLIAVPVAAGGGLDRRLCPRAGLAVLRRDGPRARHPLVLAAGRGVVGSPCPPAPYGGGQLEHACAKPLSFFRRDVSPDDPIAALATAAASSALAVIRVSGQGLSSAPLSGSFAAAGTLPACRATRSTTLVIRDGAEDVDEVLRRRVQGAAQLHRGGRGGDLLPWQPPGDPAGSCPCSCRSGFRAAGPGEFTQRAFLNGRMDLTRAEAVNEIVRAQTDRARGLALQRLTGAIESRITAARGRAAGPAGRRSR